ncbi:MAG: DEAD/DEAH box helicase [Deltaproteobacteria bacterium]|nr:MAG: DEAD/DEAH box helicase [Deltaproteobacteria bacterium]
MPTFSDLQLIHPLRQALENEGYAEATPVQAKAIPHVLRGRDLLGIAQTGTGKTAAFALPILHRLGKQKLRRKRQVQALVLAPTRELATQIGASFDRYGAFLDVSTYVLYGGVPVSPQITALSRGVDIVVATPGRLLDLERKHHVFLDHVQWLVLDEADRMLDMGFIGDIRRVLRKVPRERQTLMFSATMAKEIEHLAKEILDDPALVEVAPPASTAEVVEQKVMFLRRLNKIHLLLQLIADPAMARGLVFTRTKRGADRLHTLLAREGVRAEVIHGDYSQAARNQALERFRDGESPLLIATDVASRGLDIDGVTHVFNFDLPLEAAAYVHRIGRTGRAGQAGVAISLCDETEGGLLRDIERLIGTPLAPDLSHRWHDHEVLPDRDASGPVRHGGRTKNRGKKRRR